MPLSCPTLTASCCLCCVNSTIADLGGTGPACPLGHGPLLSVLVDQHSLKTLCCCCYCCCPERINLDAIPTPPESSFSFPGHALSTLGSVNSVSGKTYGYSTGRNSVLRLKIMQHQNKAKLRFWRFSTWGHGAGGGKTAGAAAAGMLEPYLARPRSGFYSEAACSLQLCKVLPEQKVKAEISSPPFKSAATWIEVTQQHFSRICLKILIFQWE